MGLSQQAFEAGGSPSLGTQVRVGAAPTTPGRVDTTRRPGPASETGRCKRSLNQWGKLRNRDAGSNLVDSGRSAVHDHRLWVVDSEAGSECRWGGHGEGLRRTRGESAGAKLGT